MEQSEPIPENSDNVHSITDTPLYRLRNFRTNQEHGKLSQEELEREDKEARDALRKHRHNQALRLGLHAVRSEKE